MFNGGSDLFAALLARANSGGGSGKDYNNLSNKPQINSVTLSGNLSSADLGLQDTIDANNKLDASYITGSIPSDVTATTQATSDDSTKVATTAFVHDVVDELPEPMVFTGSITLTADSTDTTKCSITVSDPSSAASIKKGYTYKVTSIAVSPVYTGTLKVGDTLIANKNAPVVTAAWVENTDWTVVPSGDETGYVVGKASGTTQGHLMSWGANGYTSEDSGVAVETTISDSDAKIPTSKAVKTAVDRLDRVKVDSTETQDYYLQNSTPSNPADGDYWFDGSDLVASDITAMTGYAKAQTASAIAATDTLNQAMGKLEKKADDNTSSLGSKQNQVLGSWTAGTATTHSTPASTDTVLEALQKIDNNQRLDETNISSLQNTYTHNPRTNYIDKIYMNSYINKNGGVTYDSSLRCTDYIPLEANKTYYYDKLYYKYYAFYNANKELIASFDTLGNISGNFTTPAGTKYGRFSTLYGLADIWISDINFKPSTYDTMMSKPAAIENGSISRDSIAKKTISSDELAIVEHDSTTNYIKEWLPNTYIQMGVPTYANGLYATTNVFLDDSTSYYHSGLYAGHYAFYDASGRILSAVGQNTSLPNPFTPPTGTVYARFTANVEPSSAWIYTANSAPSTYAEYLTLPSGNANNDPCDYSSDDICTFHKCLCIGDSLTAGVFNHKDSGSVEYTTNDNYSYPTYLTKLTNIDVTNLGISSATSGEWYTAKASDDLSGYDIAIIQLGVNDNIRMGTLEMTLEQWFADTTKCGFANIITKLKNENNNIKIFVANIIPASSYHSESYIAFSDYLLNWVATTYANDENVIPLDIQQYGHTLSQDAYNCGHLSAYGYYRLAKDYKSYISWYMAHNPSVFKEIQFIGTTYWYDNPNA